MWRSGHLATIRHAGHIWCMCLHWQVCTCSKLPLTLPVWELKICRKRCQTWHQIGTRFIVTSAYHGQPLLRSDDRAEQCWATWYAVSSFVSICYHLPYQADDNNTQKPLATKMEKPGKWIFLNGRRCWANLELVFFILVCTYYTLDIHAHSPPVCNVLRWL